MNNKKTNYDLTVRAESMNGFFDERSFVLRIGRNHRKGRSKGQQKQTKE